MIDTPNTPWGTMDAIVELVRDFFAAIGVVATLAFIIGYFWGSAAMTEQTDIPMTYTAHDGSRREVQGCHLTVDKFDRLSGFVCNL